ncbi:hypothetical protein B484DRAFT_471402 [Ochromonadaceae sp. CCMP2298]|nr:hypothetical protein B484DRAFT_471402 [Ochromonadaceae sp. CCMP2298]
MDTPPPPSIKKAWYHTAPTASNMRASSAITPAQASPTQAQIAPPAPPPPSNKRAWYHSTEPTALTITPAQASPTQAQIAPPEEYVVVTKQPRLEESNQSKLPRQRDPEKVQQNKDWSRTYRKMLDTADELHGYEPSSEAIHKLDKDFKSMVEESTGLVRVEVMHYLELTIKKFNPHHFEFARNLITTDARGTKTTEFVFEMPTDKANEILAFILHNSNGGNSITGASVRLPVRCEVYAKPVSSRWVLTVHIPKQYGGDTFVISKSDLIHAAVDDTIGMSLM